jgi:hypothetical protein
MRGTRKLLILGALAITPAALNAQTTVLGKMKWAGTNSSFSWYWEHTVGTTTTYRNVMGGAPYSANLQFSGATAPQWAVPAHGTTSFGPAVDIFCVDYNHTVNTASGGYDAYFTSLGGTLTNTRSASKTNYLEAAWLASQMGQFGTTTTSDKAARAEIHAAMWWVMTGEPLGSFGSWKGGTASHTSLAGFNIINSTESWITQAQTKYTSVNPWEWTVVTDKCVTTAHDNLKNADAVDSCSQEFLVYNQAAPEPATIALLGTGLLATLAMTGIIRRSQTS